ncbi:hypothetical protein TRAPUB_13534 [Trametes pubescens]|uniref:Uncharacterized protein n=1 Tax=Trametes pubescens TaxID=154538 RepID=A0A1M2VQW6_TRAPU|nr:hypothetical protein TRAPUB_13534 [Trametes pubescens]
MPDKLKADWDAAMKQQLQKNRAEAEHHENMIMDGSVSTQIQVSYICCFVVYYLN